MDSTDESKGSKGTDNCDLYDSLELRAYYKRTSLLVYKETDILENEETSYRIAKEVALSF